jgi:hypothetical protein
MTVAQCGRRGWMDEEQDWDNPCECLLLPGHAGLHECGSGCGGTWAGGLPSEAKR